MSAIGTFNFRLKFLIAQPAGSGRDVHFPIARGPVQVTDEVESLCIPDKSANLAFILTPGSADEADRQGFTLVLKVETPQTGEPVGQVRVSLCDAQDHLLQSKTTGANRRAVFRSPPAHYVLQCRHAGRTCEFPANLAPDASLGD